MTISELQNQQLEARGTTGSAFVKTAALSLALILSQQSVPHREDDSAVVRQTLTHGTLSHPLSLQITELDVFAQMNRVYDDLLRNQVELDSESQRALYSNLWDLYT